MEIESGKQKRTTEQIVETTEIRDRSLQCVHHSLPVDIHCISFYQCVLPIKSADRYTGTQRFLSK